jgi:hypothetical protein
LERHRIFTINQIARVGQSYDSGWIWVFSAADHQLLSSTVSDLVSLALFVSSDTSWPFDRRQADSLTLCARRRSVSQSTAQLYSISGTADSEGKSIAPWTDGNLFELLQVVWLPFRSPSERKLRNPFATSALPAAL